MSWFPLEYGHGDLLRYLAPVPKNTESLHLTKLRGYPIKIYYNPKTYMGQMLFYRGIYEERYVKTCYNLLEEGMVFVDIGANYGLYSLIASKKVGERGKVIAFEPQSNLVPIINKSVKENSFTNVTVVHSAVGDCKKKTMLFQPSATNNGEATLSLGTDQNVGYASKESEEVPVDRLADLLKHQNVEHVHGMKMDIEGAEFTVLKNSEPFFRNAEPHFLLVECIETHLKRFGHSCTDVFTFLQDNGYRLTSRCWGRWIPFTNYTEFKEKTRSTPNVVAVHPSTEVWKKAERFFR